MRSEISYEVLKSLIEGADLGGWESEAVVDQVLFNLNQLKCVGTNHVYWRFSNDPSTICPTIGTLNKQKLVLFYNLPEQQKDQETPNLSTLDNEPPS